MFGIVLAAFAISAVMAQGVAMTLGADAEDQRAAVSQRIVVLRKGLVARSTDDAEIGPVEQLIRLKNASPSMVLILEALANVLPDDTYVNEFRFEADKVRISGITKDAPVLIELLEDSGQFRQATFVAPVIKAEKGNYFQLEISTRAFGAVKS
jgi:general secretion pathway protein L